MLENNSLSIQVLPSKGNPGRRGFRRKTNAGKNQYCEGFSAIYDSYAEKIFKYIFSRVEDEKVAEDLTAHVFMKAWENISSYEPTGAPIITWLYTIAHNAIVDHYRTQKETVTLEGKSNLSDGGLSPEEAMEKQMEKELLQQAITRLTADQKNVVLLRYIDGLTTEEIAFQLGKRTGTIRALQMRALQSLSRKMLQRP